MYTIHISLGLRSTSVQVSDGNTARQVIDFLRQEKLIPRFQGSYYLRFNGSYLPPDTPLGHCGVGPGDWLELGSAGEVGFGGGGKETLLQNLIKSKKNK